MSTQKSLDEDIERIDKNVNGLFAKVSELGDRLDELEEENERLRAELEETKSTARTAYSIAGETSDSARADGGPSKTKRAEHLSRNEVVRQAVSSGRAGSVTGADVKDMALPQMTLYHSQVRNAWDKLAARWSCLSVQERDDRDNRLIVDADDLEEELVRVVDEDLSDQNLTERFCSGRN